MWTGTVKWFNVAKGYGYIIPHHAEANGHGYELLARQVSKAKGMCASSSPKTDRGTDPLFQGKIQKEGYRSLADNSQVKFRVGIGLQGRLEARHITNLEGGEPEGHHVHPGQIRFAFFISVIGSSTNLAGMVIYRFRCYNCNGYGHIAKKCKEPRVEGNACNRCGSTEHKYANCPGRDPQQ